MEWAVAQKDSFRRFIPSNRFACLPRPLTVLFCLVHTSPHQQIFRIWNSFVVRIRFSATRRCYRVTRKECKIHLKPSNWKTRYCVMEWQFKTVLTLFGLAMVFPIPWNCIFVRSLCLLWFSFELSLFLFVTFHALIFFRFPLFDARTRLLCFILFPQ